MNPLHIQIIAKELAVRAEQVKATALLIEEAKPKQCISCHSERKNEDYIFSHTLK